MTKRRVKIKMERTPVVIEVLRIYPYEKVDYFSSCAAKSILGLVLVERNSTMKVFRAVIKHPIRKGNKSHMY